MKIWPFMFAASAILDYRFVVRPDFLDAEQDTLFREQLEIDGSDQNRIRAMSFSDSKNKTLHCWYRARPILIAEETQTDSAGRKLFCASGIIADELPSDESARQLTDMTRKFQPLLEKNLAAFMAADRSWKPTVVPASDLAAEPNAAPVVISAVNPAEQRASNPPSTNKSSTNKPAINASTAILTTMMILSLALSALLFSRYRALEADLTEIKWRLLGSADTPETLPGRSKTPVHQDSEALVRKEAEPPVRKEPELPARKELPKNIE